MSNTLPSQQKALLLEEQQGNLVLGSTNVYHPGPGQILMKVKATALNPVDWKIQRHGLFVYEYPAILGSDMSGEVVAVGEGVTMFAIGDLVFCNGRSTNDYASFQEFALADEYHLAKLPSNISYEEAASIPLCLTTAFIGMYHKAPHGIGLVNPVKPSGQGHYKNEPFVVIGGASSVGQFAIQLARLSGFSPIITTASLKHSSYLHSLGANHVLDRHLSTPQLKSQINHLTDREPIRYVFDAISSPETQHTGDDILAPGGYLVLVLSPAFSSADKHVLAVLAIRQFEHNIELLKGLYAKLTEWVESRVIQPNKIKLLPGGLSAIGEGLHQMESNQVSGVKLVVRPEDTSNVAETD